MVPPSPSQTPFRRICARSAITLSSLKLEEETAGDTLYGMLENINTGVNC